MRLRGKIALVTGSSSGIGAAIAAGFAREGADMVVNYNRNRAGAAKTAQEVEKLGRKALVVKADVGDPREVEQMFQRVEAEFGRLDILVNNAGVTPKRPFKEFGERDWDWVMNTNVKSVFLCCKQALRLMGPGSSVLNISSIHAVQTVHNFSIYAATKGAMESLTRSLAIEFGELGIRVNAIRPGWIQVERDGMDPASSAYAGACERIPLSRAGEVSDIVPAAILLCSEEAAYITGQVLTIDGGHGAVLSTAFPKGHVDGGARG